MELSPCRCALDGKHIRTKCPAHGESLFFHFKRYHSYVLLALVDFRFLWVQVGALGAASDSQFRNMSALKHAVIPNNIGIPDLNFCLVTTVRCRIIGGNAFALNEWKEKPFAATWRL